MRVSELDDETQAALERTFDETVFPVLTPLAVDSGHPFPYISNLSLSLAVELEEPTSDGVELHFARVKIPPTLPRFVPVEGSSERRFVLLEDLIAHHLDGLFPGMHVRDSYLFRVTRDADLDLQEDEADDLLRAIESELRRRRFGEPVRLEIERGMPEYMRDFLCSSLELEAVDCYEIDGLDGAERSLADRQASRLRASARQAVHAGDSQASDRRHGHLRADSRRRHSAAPSVRVVRSGHSVLAAGRRRSEECSPSRRRSTAPPGRTRRSFARS